MSNLKKYKVKFNRKSTIITFGLSSNGDSSGHQEGINSFVEDQTGLSPNPSDDLDKFRYTPVSASTYTFKFYNTGTTSYDTNLSTTGLVSASAVTYDDKIFGSFYIIQLFNTFKTEAQQKLHTGYYNGYSFIVNTGTTVYNLDSETEFTNHYISNNFINNLTGATSATTLYGKFLFYNASTGKLHWFINEDLSGNTTEQKLYVTFEFNFDNKSYVPPANINLLETINTGYTNQLNNTLESFFIERASFPDGTALSGNTYTNNF